MKRVLIITAMLFAVCVFTLMVIGGKPEEHCRIVGDHEIVTNSCIPYCPPTPSECG